MPESDCLFESTLPVHSTTPEIIGTEKELGNIVGVEAGFGHALLLRADGVVVSFGCNLYGQLGREYEGNSNGDEKKPLALYFSNSITEISAGFRHSLALDSGGNVFAWGHNYHGEIGNGTNIDLSVPTKLVGLQNIISISAGYDYSLALGDDGSIWGWGDNSGDQMLFGQEKTVNVPTFISKVPGAKKVVAGGRHAFVLY